MFNAFAKATVTKDNASILSKAVQELSNLDVLVGIPEDTAERKDQKDDKINNAELAYIHTHGVRSLPMRKEMEESIKKGKTYGKALQMYIKEHGSPLWHVPPRPIIEPAIEDEVNREIIVDDLKKAAEAALDRDERKTRDELTKAGLDAQNMVRDWFENPKNEWPPNAEATIKQKGSDMPLIDTGELRKSITYVIRNKGEAND